MLKEHEKFYAFLALGAAVLAIVALAVLYPPEKDQVIRLLDGALGGFLLALGAAANALFRVGTVGEESMKQAAGAVIQQSQPAQPVTVVNTEAEPVPITESALPADNPDRPVVTVPPSAAQTIPPLRG